MAIANRTTAEVYALSGVMENTLKALLVYRSDSRNPALNSNVDTYLAALKTALDATVADATPNAG
ncbi:hypothetical protein VAC51_00007 [Variovorax phage VAC_51]|uniref:Uncharacterized protein n=1 Tax=Variovorax phage VAC_51 TaxID=2985242 RepID=A0A9N6ZHT6_9CAUD|nr:hypothetical protein VAC51_00007 [Variovorax phage VAC_51]